MKHDQKVAIDSLLNRNVSEIIRRDELEAQLYSGKKLKIYLGVDPSAPEIHLGHAVVLRKLRQFQDLGHEIILLIGDFTAQIGDPTGKSKERTPLNYDQVRENAATYKEQASKIVRFDGENPAKMQFNNDWLSTLTLKEVIHLAAQFTVQQMIERDMFQERLKAGASIGLHEFLYPLLVGYDSVKLDVDVEIGGNDQLFNMRAGRTLMEKLKNKKKVVLTCDLLIGSDGSKMSKSAGNSIAITTSATDMFGQLMAVKDSLIVEYARLCTDMTEEELKQLSHRLESSENPRDVKMDMAQRVTAMYTSADEAETARMNFTHMFSKRDAYAGIPPVDSFYPVPLAKMPLYELVSLIAAKSKSEARRLIESRAVDVDGTVIVDANEVIDLSQSRVIKVGKHHFSRVQFVNTSDEASQ